MLVIARRIRLALPAAAGVAALAVGGVPAAALGVEPDVQKPAVQLQVAKQGDTPADYPGASRSLTYQAPRTIAVVRPERTIVRESDQLLSIVLACAAMVLALGGLGVAIARTGPARIARH